MIRIIDHLYTQLVTTSTAVLSLIYTLYSSPWHTDRFSGFTSCILATDFNTVVTLCLYCLSHCNCSTQEVFPTQPNSFLAVSSDSFSTAISSDSLSSSRYIAWARTHRKLLFYRYQQYPISQLLIRCRENVFTETLPENKRLLWLDYFGFRASCHKI
jgi:hypothetical protein